MKPKTLIIGSARKPRVKRVINKSLDSLKKLLDVVEVSYSEDANFSKRELDLVLIFGGDGTILSAARMLGGNKAPSIGINMGRRGFLAQSSVKTMYVDIKDYVEGTIPVCKRLILNVSLVRKKGDDYKAIARFLALNDAVVSALRFARMVRLRLSVNWKFVQEYPCDGLIISTPTGSTAHSLSAGGPIAVPHSNLFIVSPIATHAFVDRSLIVPSNETISIVHGKNTPESCLTIDGQVEHPMYKGDELRVSRSAKSFHLVEFDKESFYDIVRRKIR